ncbi:MAG: tetratricopeptide repeat protein [Myxococcaceae bacterium]|nr:tetratricopeptide repeat protein [Myxococcaceae bacterium]MCA3015018.1 tetratricopeptide repeat protein [Myxococcaceae bacterium]
MRAALTTILLVLPAATLAQVVPRNDALVRGQQQVEEGDFEDAVKTLEAGIDQPDVTDDQLAELYRLLGLAHLYLGHEDKARAAYEKLLQARPDYELPKATPPKIRTLYARLKEDIRKRRVRPVTLSVAGLPDQPPGTAVTVEARIDDLALGAKAKLFYRRSGAQHFSSIDFTRDKADRALHRATIPAFELPEEPAAYDVEYYVEVADAAQRRLAGRGDPFSPLMLRVLAKVAAAEVEKPRAWYQNPVVWIVIGVGAAAATTGVVVLATQRPTGTLPITIQVEGMP